jgi:hypothetical protein
VQEDREIGDGVKRTVKRWGLDEILLQTESKEKDSEKAVQLGS